MPRLLKAETGVRFPRGRQRGDHHAVSPDLFGICPNWNGGFWANFVLGLLFQPCHASVASRIWPASLVYRSASASDLPRTAMICFVVHPASARPPALRRPCG
jgi:hypothetical protein